MLTTIVPADSASVSAVTPPAAHAAEDVRAPARLGDEWVLAGAQAGIAPKPLHALVTAGDLDALRRHLPGTANPAVLPAGGSLNVLGDPEYPAHLAQSLNPPRIVYRLGPPALTTWPGIALSGTRSPSPFGTAVCDHVASVAGHLAATLVTGGAAGCDEHASRAALQYSVPLVMVVPTGPDTPASGRAAALTDAVLASGGAVLSEHPFGTGARTAPGYTPAPLTSRLMARNRIIVGLGAYLVAASGTLGSGTSAAVWAALGARRPVIAPQPLPSGAHHPDTQLPRALAHLEPVGVERLRGAGCPAGLATQLAATAPLAHATPAGSEALALVMSVMWHLGEHHETPST